MLTYSPYESNSPSRRDLGEKVKLRHYERQKQEKTELTHEIARLSAILKREQAKTTTRLNQKTVPVHSVWSNFAIRQLELRLASEAQRRWLLSAIAGKIELVDGLKSVVRQHLKISALIAAQSEGESGLFLEPTDELLYAIDMQDIDELYMQTDVVFGACGLDLTSEKKYMQRAVTADSTGVSIKFGRKQNMMFSYQQTCQSMWMLSNHVHRQFDRVEYEDFEDPDTTHAAKFRITCRLPDGSFASLKQRIITRRFMENDRMVLVWKSVIAGEGPLSGIQTDESGWGIIQPSSTGPGTTMQVCIKHVPLHLNNPSSERLADQFDGLLQSVLQEADREITTGAEALLLEDAVMEIDLIARRHKRARKAARSSD